MALGNTASCTVTGTAGPGETITAGVFTGVTSFTFDPVNEMFSFVDSNGITRYISIAQSPTITITTSAGNYTVTVA